jgi:hypothetical protein
LMSLSQPLHYHSTAAETLAGVISMEMVTIYGLHAMLKYSGYVH